MTSSITRNTVVSLYINSKDRINISDPTTDFTIGLRKSLRNINSLNVNGVVIPRTDTLININNNTLIGFIIIDGVETAFEVAITSSDYDEAELSAELETQLNTNLIMITFPITWTVSYDTSLKRMIIDCVYLAGTSITWSVSFEFTALIDVIGLGDASSETQTFTASEGFDTLSIPCNRGPVITRALSYNITSEALTDSINTSYINSPSKIFNIDDSNNIMNINSQLTATDINEKIPTGAGATNTSIYTGDYVSISGDGNVIATSTRGYGVFVYSRISDAGSWIQRLESAIFNTDVGLQGDSVALSRDGATLAVGIKEYNGYHGTLIYTKNGNEWIQQGDILEGPELVTSSRSAVALSANGDTLVVCGDLYASTANIFIRSNGLWSQQTIPATGNVRSCALSDDGDTLALGNISGADIYVRELGVWTQQGGTLVSTSGSYEGTDVSISADGNRVAIRSENDAGGVIPIAQADIYLRTGVSWSAEDFIQLIPPQSGFLSTPAQTWPQISMSADGDRLVLGLYGYTAVNPVYNIGAVGIYLRTGVSWAEEHVIEGEAQEDRLGNGVAMSSNGDIIAAGGNSPSKPYGFVSVYDRTGVNWDIAQSKIAGDNPKGVAQQGYSIAMSGDGNTCVVGGAKDANSIGAVWVYIRQGLEWVQQGDKLVASDYTGASEQGTAVTISNDGNTIAFGGMKDNNSIGAVWVFTRNDNTWTQQGNKIVGTPVTPFSRQGGSVALSGDGKTLASGEGSLDNNVAAWVFVLQSGAWIQQGAKVTASDPGGFSYRRVNVSLTYDGDRLALSKHYDIGSGFSGGLWVFDRNNTIWSQQTPALRTDDNDVQRIGREVAISDDGNTIALSSNVIYNRVGAGIVIYRYTTAWNVEYAEFPVGPGRFIYLPDEDNVGVVPSIAISGDGNTVVLGHGVAYAYTVGIDNVGAVWVYKRTGTVWTQISELRSSYMAMHFGASVSLNHDGTILMVGANLSQDETGAVSFITIGDANVEQQYSVSITPKTYTITDLTNHLNKILQLDDFTSLTATYNSSSETMTLSVVLTGTVTSHVFYIDASSTFNDIVWPVLEYKSEHTSSGIDFSINNNVIHSITNHTDNLDNVLVSIKDSVSFRKYKAGYTIDVDTPIDIQLRDERDRIIDLNGADWIMTIYADIFN